MLVADLDKRGEGCEKDVRRRVPVCPVLGGGEGAGAACQCSAAVLCVLGAGWLGLVFCEAGHYCGLLQ